MDIYGYMLIYPLVMTNSLLLKMTIEIVSFSHQTRWFSIVMLSYQRVNHCDVSWRLNPNRYVKLLDSGGFIHFYTCLYSIWGSRWHTDFDYRGRALQASDGCRRGSVDARAARSFSRSSFVSFFLLLDYIANSILWNPHPIQSLFSFKPHKIMILFCSNFHGFASKKHTQLQLVQGLGGLQPMVASLKAVGGHAAPWQAAGEACVGLRGFEDWRKTLTHSYPFRYQHSDTNGTMDYFLRCSVYLYLFFGMELDLSIDTWESVGANHTVV